MHITGTTANGLLVKKDTRVYSVTTATDISTTVQLSFTSNITDKVAKQVVICNPMKNKQEFRQVQIPTQESTARQSE